MNFIEKLNHFWANELADCEPVAYTLRDVFTFRWVRFHSLPASKRYPENESEYQTALHRHNQVIDSLVGESLEVALLTTAYSDNRQEARRYPQLDELDPKAGRWRVIAKHELEGDGDGNDFWHVSASCWKWEIGVFDPLLRLIADEVVANVMIADPVEGWVYHPYDGGADVILRDREGRDALRESYPEWLSKLPSGL